MNHDAFLATIRERPDELGPLQVYADWLEEHGDPGGEQIRNYLNGEGAMLQFPGDVGERFLICTVTLYYVGEIVEKGLGYVSLKNSSWVHWTGRLSDLCRLKDFSKVRGRTPRTEFCGSVILATQSIVSWYPGDWLLPTEAMT